MGRKEKTPSTEKIKASEETTIFCAVSYLQCKILHLRQFLGPSVHVTRESRLPRLRDHDLIRYTE